MGQAASAIDVRAARDRAGIEHVRMERDVA
jgi:hypothetical protein